MDMEKLRTMVAAVSRLVADHTLTEQDTLARTTSLMADLVAHDDWLPPAFANPHPQYYQQYLLYGDPLDRFSLVSFVWGPGQKTPIHDHTVWGVIGMLRGAETEQHYQRDARGRLEATHQATLLPGQVACVSPSIGDIHQVSNAHADQVSISIHLYGGNIGRIRRHVFDPSSSAAKDFISGYSNATTPNLWVAGGPET